MSLWLCYEIPHSKFDRIQIMVPDIFFFTYGIALISILRRAQFGMHLCDPVRAVRPPARLAWRQKEHHERGLGGP
jgi:hypothetical protein